MNICSFMGRLTRDPELLDVGGGKSVANFCIAVKNPTKAENKPDATFIECIAWEKTADLIGRDFKKGSRIIVSAAAKTESWQDKESGKKRSRIKFVVQKFWYVETKQESVSEGVSSGSFSENTGDEEPF